MTDKKDLPNTRGIYIFHFDGGIGKYFTRALCIGIKENTDRPRYFDFAYRNEFNPSNSIIVRSLREGYFILSENNVICFKRKTDFPDWNDNKNYDSRVKKDRKKYSMLDEMLSEAGL